MKISLEPFARECVESSFGTDLETGARAAIRHYARRLRSAQQPQALPGFRRDASAAPAAAGSRSSVELELPVPPEDEAALRGEAHRGRVTVDQIVAHAIFVFCADLDRFDARSAAGQGQADGAQQGSEERWIRPRYRIDACADPAQPPPRRRRAVRVSPLLGPRRRGRLRGGSRFGKR